MPRLLFHPWGVRRTFHAAPGRRYARGRSLALRPYNFTALRFPNVVKRLRGILARNRLRRVKRAYLGHYKR